GARGPGGDYAAHGHHEFAPHVLDLVVGQGAVCRVEHALGDPLAVAQVHEDEPAVIAPPVHPAHESNGLPRVGGAEGAARMRALPVAHGLHTRHPETSRLPTAPTPSARPPKSTPPSSPT